MLGSAVFSAPTEYKDIHETTLDIARIDTNTPDHRSAYLVTVERQDDLVTKDTGELVAERITKVQLAFSVKDNCLMCNGHKVPVGISHKKVKAEILTLSEHKLTKEVEKQFDKGIVDIAFDVKADEVRVGGIIIRRLYIEELIKEVNGETVKQKDYVQQMIDIYPDGSFITHKPKNHAKQEKNSEKALDAAAPRKSVQLINDKKPESDAAMAATSDRIAAGEKRIEDCMVDFAIWYYSLPPVFRGMLAGMTSVMLFLTVFFLVQAVLRWKDGVSYSEVQSYENVESFSEKDKLYGTVNKSVASTTDLSNQ